MSTGIPFSSSQASTSKPSFIQRLHVKYQCLPYCFEPSTTIIHRSMFPPSNSVSEFSSFMHYYHAHSDSTRPSVLQLTSPCLPSMKCSACRPTITTTKLFQPESAYFFLPARSPHADASGQVLVGGEKGGWLCLSKREKEGVEVRGVLDL